MSRLSYHDFDQNTHFAIITKEGEPAVATPRRLLALDGLPLCVCVNVSTIDGKRMFGSIVTQSALKARVKDSNLSTKEIEATAKIAAGKHGAEPCRFQQAVPAASLVVLPRGLVDEFKVVADGFLTEHILENLSNVSTRGPL